MKKYLRLGAVLLMGGLTCLAALKGGLAPAQAAVTLLYFQGQHNGDSVLLEWATGTELNTAYFYVERAIAVDGPYQMVDGIGLVPSAAPPDGLSGAEYQRLDDGVLADQDYWYILVEVESVDGAEIRTQPIKVAQADTQPTNTPTRTATPSPTATVTRPISGSPTAVPTATPTATASSSRANGTPIAARTASIRTTATLELEGAGPITTTPDQIASSQGSNSAQQQATPPTGGYPGPTAQAPEIAMQSDPDGYPAPPPTPQVFATASYPEPKGPRDLTNGDGTPVPNIGANNRGPGEDGPDESPAPGNEPALGTLFLWLGFVAALIVFVSAVAGAVYFYNRQRAGNN